MADPKPKVTADDLRTMLHVRYRGSEWALFEEVHDSTGYGMSRSCDAIAMHLWPSKGLELHGFEIKTSRADWLNELRNPDKSAMFRQWCDRWWLVVSDRDVVKKDLPPDWGLMRPKAGKLVVSRGAPKLKPEPPDRGFLAALLRRRKQGTPKHAAIMDGEYRRGLKTGEKLGARFAGTATRRLKALRKSIRKFEATSGLKVTGYNGRKIGTAVDIVMKLQSRYGSLQKLERAGAGVLENAGELTRQLLDLHRAVADAGLLAGSEDGDV